MPRSFSGALSEEAAHDHVYSCYTTIDGHTFRVATVAFTLRRVNSSKKHEIRLIAQKILMKESLR